MFSKDSQERILIHIGIRNTKGYESTNRSDMCKGYS